MTTEPADGWTPDRLVDAFHAALSAGDIRGVEASLHVLALRAPDRAGRLYHDTQTALRIAEIARRPEGTTAVQPAAAWPTNHPAPPPTRQLEHYHRAATELLHQAQPAIAAWRTARVRLAAAYAAVDTAPDGLWRARIASLVGAREGARTAARAVDDVDGEYDRLWRALPEAARGQASSLDELAGAADLPPLEPGDLPERGTSCSADLEQAIRAQDAHIAEINRLAGPAGPDPAAAAPPD